MGLVRTNITLHVNVPASLPLEIEASEAERWLRSSTAWLWIGRPWVRRHSGGGHSNWTARRTDRRQRRMW